MPAAPPAPPPAAAPAAAPKPAPTSTPAPAPKPAAAKTPPPAPSREDTEPSFMGEYAAELDQISGEDLQPPQVRKPKGKPAEKPGAAVKPPEGDPKPAEGESAVGTAAAAAPVAEPTTVPEIRKAYTALKKKASEEYEPTIQRLQARVKELETSNPADVKTLTEKLEAAEKRREELENEIHFVDYSKSKDFQEKFQKPYQQAWSKALYEITQLSRTLEDGSARKATQDDILALANAPLDQLDKMAEDWFPNSSARVIRHVEKLKDLAEAQSEALETARKEGAERAKTSELQRKTSTEKTVQMLDEAHAAITQKWPKMFGKIEDDAEGNALLEKGEAMYQKVFRPTDENRPKTPEEAIQLHALIRNKVRNHDRVVHWLKKANAQIKELETALAQYEKSDPNGGLDRGAAVNGGGIKNEIKDALDELDAIDKKR